MLYLFVSFIAVIFFGILVYYYSKKIDDEKNEIHNNFQVISQVAPSDDELENNMEVPAKDKERIMFDSLTYE